SFHQENKCLGLCGLREICGGQSVNKTASRADVSIGLRFIRKLVLFVGCSAVVGNAALLWLAHRRPAEKYDTENAAQLRAGAEHGDAEAMYRLAGFYLYGQEVQHDDAEAFRWYRKASEQKHARAEYAIGFLYYEGRGVEKDRAAADHWFHTAALH